MPSIDEMRQHILDEVVRNLKPGQTFDPTLLNGFDEATVARTYLSTLQVKEGNVFRIEGPSSGDRRESKP